MDELNIVMRQLNPLAYLAIVIIGFFLVRVLRQVDENQRKLWEHMDEHEKRLSTIEGEHRAYTGQGVHP